MIICASNTEFGGTDVKKEDLDEEDKGSSAFKI
jgi:hypothetical protein